MPRYFFHVHDGEDIIDGEGTVLADLTSAQAEAIRYVAELLKGVALSSWNGEEWRLDVTDEVGFVLFSLYFFVTASPATSGRHRSAGGTFGAH